MRILSKKELESTRGIWFLLDEIRKNQAAIDAIHAARQARLEWLAGPPGAKLPPLSTRDAVIMAESPVPFNSALAEILRREYSGMWPAMARRHVDGEPFEDAEFHKAVRAKLEKKAQGVPVEPGIREAFEKYHGQWRPRAFARIFGGRRAKPRSLPPCMREKRPADHAPRGHGCHAAFRRVFGAGLGPAVLGRPAMRACRVRQGRRFWTVWALRGDMIAMLKTKGS